MDDNDLYAQERTDTVPVPYTNYAFQKISAVGSNLLVTVYIDGSSKGTVTLVSGVGDFTIADIDLTGYSQGLHEIRIHFTGATVISMKWIKAQDNNLLTVWGNVSQVQTESGESESWDVTYTNRGILSHRLSQGW